VPGVASSCEALSGLWARGPKRSQRDACRGTPRRVGICPLELPNPCLRR
jgi:hypothetical protein